ncbi:hypothetical protein ACFQWH_19095 [Mycolicibacterium sp. GCM10028919]|uniref:hypothetical protein n=1 Tax=Mycolicibacterium sp. GCM10028919 TaxID=3273401 RepID=UPI00360634BA
MRYEDVTEVVPKVRTALAGQVAIFVVGATSAVQVANVTATVLSIVCLVLVPGFLLVRLDTVDVVPLGLAALGWAGYIASCLVNGVSLLWPNAIAPAAFSLYFIGLTVLTSRSIESIATVLAGIGLGTVVFFLTEGIELTSTGNFLHFWKYGVAHGVTVVFLYAMIRMDLPRLVLPAALAIIGVASLGLNFRSHALVCLIAAAILIARHLLGHRISRAWQFVGVAAFGVLFAFLMPIAARWGMFGAALERKTLEQDATDLPLLLAGRTEPPMTLTAIADRPLLGWGSGTNLTPEVYTRAEHLAIAMGFDPSFPFDLYWRLPATDYSAMHSILLGSWAEGGILAALLPAWLLVACVVVVWRNVEFGRWSALALTVALQCIWDLLFSPWTYNTIAEYACVALLFCAITTRRPAATPG